MRMEPMQTSLLNGKQDGMQTQKAEVQKLSENADSASVKATELNLPQSDIEKKREQAQKEAMRIITDAFADEKKMDEMQNKIRDSVDELLNENKSMVQEINRNRREMDNLARDWCVAPDSQEQKDLKLLCRYEDIMSGLSTATLTEEEMARVTKLENGNMTEYQKEALSLHTTNNGLRRSINENRDAIAANNQALRDSEIERLKSHGLVDAQKQADAVMKSAGDEIMQMLLEDSMEYVEEKMEEAEEAAEKREEKEEEIEEKEEKAEERKEQLDKLTEEVAADLHKTQEKINQEVNEVLEKLKLLSEDVKGISIDTLR